MTKPAIVLPDRPFLFTIDQIASVVSVQESTVREGYLHYEGRSTGACPRDRMLARNIAPAGDKPEWRVDEKDFKRWMRFKGFKWVERGYYR